MKKWEITTDPSSPSAGNTKEEQNGKPSSGGVQTD